MAFNKFDCGGIVCILINNSSILYLIIYISTDNLCFLRPDWLEAAYRHDQDMMIYKFPFRSSRRRRQRSRWIHFHLPISSQPVPTGQVGSRLSGAAGGKKPVLVSMSKSCAAKVDVSATWGAWEECLDECRGGWFVLGGSPDITREQMDGFKRWRDWMRRYVFFYYNSRPVLNVHLSSHPTYFTFDILGTPPKDSSRPFLYPSHLHPHTLPNIPHLHPHPHPSIPLPQDLRTASSSPSKHPYR